MDQVIRAVAANVRALRTARGMSLNELATASGTGKGTLSRIEAAQANPTVETLYALADALDVPFGSLVAAPSVELTRAAEIPEVAGAVHARMVTQAAGASLVEALDITFPAGTVRRSSPHPNGVREHLYLLEGRLRAGPEGSEVELDAGDVLRFAGDVGHSYEPLDGAPARALVLMAY